MPPSRSSKPENRGGGKRKMGLSNRRLYSRFYSAIARRAEHHDARQDSATFKKFPDAHIYERPSHCSRASGTSSQHDFSLHNNASSGSEFPVFLKAMGFLIPKGGL